jgi:hypothetical protein
LEDAERLNVPVPTVLSAGVLKVIVWLDGVGVAVAVAVAVRVFDAVGVAVAVKVEVGGDVAVGVFVRVGINVLVAVAEPNVKLIDCVPTPFTFL